MAVSQISQYPIFLGTDSYNKLKTEKKLALLEKESAGVTPKETDPIEKVVHRLGIENLKNINANTKDNDAIDEETKKNVRFYYFFRSAACYFNGEEIEQRLLDKDNCIKRCFRKICCCKGFERKLEKVDGLKQDFQENFLKEIKNDAGDVVEDGNQENGRLDSLLESEAYKALVVADEGELSAYDELKIIRRRVEHAGKKHRKAQESIFFELFLEPGEHKKKVAVLKNEYNAACKQQAEKYEELKETLDTLRESIDGVLEGDLDFSKQDLSSLYEASKIWYEFHTVLTHGAQGTSPPPTKSNNPNPVKSKAKNGPPPVQLQPRTHKDPLKRHKPLKDEELDRILKRGQEIVNLPVERERIVKQQEALVKQQEEFEKSIALLSDEDRVKRQDEFSEKRNELNARIEELDKQKLELDKKIPEIKGKNDWKGIYNPGCNCFLNTALWMLFEVCPESLDLTKPLPERREALDGGVLRAVEFLPYSNIDKAKYAGEGAHVFGAFVTEADEELYIPDQLILDKKEIDQCRKTREAFRVLVREAYDCVRSGKTFENGEELRRLAYYCGVVESASVRQQEAADECFSRLLNVVGGTDQYNNFKQPIKATTTIHLPSEMMKEFKFDKRNKTLKKLNQDHRREFEEVAKLPRPKNTKPHKTEIPKLEACTIDGHKYKEVNLQEYVMTDKDEIMAADTAVAGISYHGAAVSNDGDGGCQEFSVPREGMSIEDVLKEATQKEAYIVNTEKLQYRKLKDEKGNEETIVAPFAIKKSVYELKDGKYPDQLGFTFKSDANGGSKAVTLRPKFKPKFGKFTFEEWYELKSVMIHTGGVEGGHWYYAEYLGNGNWLKKNDRRVSVESQKDIDLANVKFVLYKKCESA